MKMLTVDGVTRRHMLGATLMSSFGLAMGCHQSEREGQQVAPEADRVKIPLRIVYAGEIGDLDVIKRGWGSISDHPLEIQSLPLTRDSSGVSDSEMVSACIRCDVAIVPLSLLPALRQADAIVPLSKTLAEQADQDLGALYPAVRNAAAVFAGEMICMPLGAIQPCLLTNDPVSHLDSWEAYDELVQSWGGLAAEPTAVGWAAVSFLMRCLEQERWLFDGDSLTPVLSDASYVEALELMVKTCRRCQYQALTPVQVWESVASGALKGGITSPSAKLMLDANLSVNRLPGGLELEKIMLDPFSPVGVLSASCRQTAIARQFALWISGGDGSQSVRSEISAMGSVRRSPVLVQETGSPVLQSSYQQFLVERLNQPVTLPSLQILEAKQYFDVLDQQVRLAILGENSPSESLTKVCEQWEALTEQVGRDEQMTVWKRINGVIS